MAQRDDLPAMKQLTPGTDIGGYVIERKLGVGGMAVVYGAVQPRIGKRVAIKVLSRTFDDPSAVERFEQEARVVNAIGHRNIVDVFQFGELPDGRSFFVMEWLEGETLGARIKRSPLGLRLSVAILAEICDALEAAHEQGVVHRDLKADNVFLVADRGGRAVKLLDFGLAKLVAGDGAEAVHNTGVGILVGTPSYMSPEQARAKDVDARTDIYSLGCLAFQMLTGELPFRADNPLDLLNLHLDAPPPSAASMAANVPRALSDLVKQMMAKEPADRPSIARIRQVLEQVRDTKEAKPKSGSGLALWAIVGTCVVAGAVVAAVLVAGRRDNDGSQTPQTPQPPTTIATGSAPDEPLVDATTAPPVADPEPTITMDPEDARKQPATPVTPTRRPPPGTPPTTPLSTTPPPDAPASTDAEDVRFPGYLVVAIDVAADIAIDGTVRASNSKGGRFELRPGKHTVRITAPQRPVVEREVDVETAQTLTMTITLPGSPPVPVDAGAGDDKPAGSAAPSQD